jgi:HTH-type transcriptional regulator/antitoxin HipB
MDQIVRNPKQLGASLRRVRRGAGLSQMELGEKANLRQATISALEKGEAGSQLRTVTQVLAALGLEMVIRDRTGADRNIEDLF